MAGVSRLIRRICLLREQGSAGEAERLEREELPMAWPAVTADEAAQADLLQRIFSRETERAADAAALSELLLPHLLARLTPPAIPGRGTPSRPDPGLPAAPVVRPAVSAGSPAIPDLLDAMLAAERSNRRPLAPSMRGARPTT